LGKRPRDAGILVNPDDPEDVSDAIHRLRTSPHDRAELVRRGLARVQAFAWERMAERMYGLYKTVLSESVRPYRRTARVGPILAGTV
jgi:glycosyltransferase involved in cell wall biosynthesis